MTMRLKIMLLAGIVAATAGAPRAMAQIRYNWTGPAGVEHDWNEGDLGGGEATYWFNAGPPPANLQPDHNFNEYGSISNGGVAIIDSAISVSPAEIRLGEDAASTGRLAIRNGGSITVQPGPGSGLGTLANGVTGTGTLELRDNMGSVAIQRYTQNATSILVAQLSGSSTFTNHITSAVQTTLNGGLHLERAPGSNFVASHGNSWTLINGSPVTGQFSNVVVDPALRHNAGQVFNVSTAGNAVAVSVEQRLVLQVDRFTGAATLVNPSGHATNITFINYTLSSPGNGVSSAAGRWNSLTDQSVSGWFEANPTATDLSELNPLGSLTLSSGQSRTLGTPINANAAVPLRTDRVNVADVTLNYQLTNGQYIDAVIEPVGRINDLVLVVNPTTGATIIQNQSSQSLSFISYSIFSESESLKTDWTGLSGIPLATWFKANPSEEALSELSSTGVANMNVGNELSLGVAWDAVAGSQDLTFKYQTPDGVLHDGSVFFGAKATIADNADFNNSGRVDGVDFLTWQRGFGLAGQPNKMTGDANNDGNVNGADFTVWKSQYGTAPAAGAAIATVPEPTGAVLAVGAVIAACRGRRTVTCKG